MCMLIGVLVPQAAAVYCRISKDRTGHGLGVGRQEQDCRAWAERNGWAVAEVFIDDDISAYTGKARPDYKRLLGAIEAGTRDGLVIWHPDRLHRSPLELEGFIDLLERHPIPVGTVTAGEYDLSTPTGRMTARIVGAVARHESDHKSERIRRKHLELAQNGKVPGGGRRPFGYESDRVTVREDEAVLVREAAARVLAGDGLRTVVADWTARGVSTVTGTHWSTPTLRRLLMSGRIVGQREHHGVVVAEAEWPAILDPETGRKVRRVLEDPARFTGDTTARAYLLAGFVRCGNCGAPLVARPVRRKGIRYRRYACSVEKGGCNRVGIGAEPLEGLVAEAMFVRLDTPALSRALAKKRSRPKGAKSSLPTVEEVEWKLAELAEMFAEGEITRAEWSTARRGLTERLERARRTEAQTVRDDATVTALDKPDALRREWPLMSLDRRRRVLGAVIDSIIIAPVPRSNNRFDPDRVNIAWKL